MMYSVWNQGLGAFDYYQCPKPQESLNAPRPTHLVSRTLGSTVDQAAWPLPGNVTHIGSGQHAVGRVATRNGSPLGATGGDMSLVKAGLLFAAGVLAWRYVVRGRRLR